MDKPKVRESRSELAMKLIAASEEIVYSNVALLDSRIQGALRYMKAVTQPNMTTLDHIRRFLDGTYDDHPF